jgi:O-6-methylguanine DNA methyltransferase
MRKISDFEKRVFELISMVPKGMVTSYGEIAKTVGSLRYARAVGKACNKSPGMPKVPCHRVVMGNGCVGGFAYGKKAKVKLLEGEGIKIKSGKVQNFEKKFFKFKKT